VCVCVCVRVCVCVCACACACVCVHTYTHTSGTSAEEVPCKREPQRDRQRDTKEKEELKGCPEDKARSKVTWENGKLHSGHEQLRNAGMAAEPRAKSVSPESGMGA
jgi:ribonuclease HI